MEVYIWLDTSIVRRYCHKKLESIWFAQFSQITNSSYLIGVCAINGTVRHNFTIPDSIEFQVDLQSTRIFAVS